MINISRSSNARAAAVLLFLAVLFIMPGVAGGHAYPDHADPKVGATITTSPAVVRIWFDSDLEPVFSSIMVHAAKDDVMVDKRDGRVDSSDPKLL